MYQAVFFDIDNTLLLKKPSIQEKVFEAAIRHIPGLNFETVERAYAASEIWQGEQVKKENETGIRMPDDEYLAHVVKIYCDSLNLSALVGGELTDIFSRGYEKSYYLVPGAMKVLTQLKARGLLLGIVSNNYAGIRQALEEQGISHFFAPIIISEEVSLYKPDPEILKLACAQAGVSSNDCVYVGDHPFDILCAHEAHMDVVWMPVNQFIQVPGYIGAPEHTVSALNELLDII
ncbi:HAD family hydrolase [Acutalibacter intestini]|uniref:HAD family hydrolase n=1 Tax=Acutalibacter intestini TaxID=3093659 RepID=UPI002AC9D079|nr:HAD family hydrolase [Acutalibacter sp. M00204]